jgi:hypothetical protein
MNNIDILILIMRVINISLIGIGIAAWLIFYTRYRMIMVIAPISWLIHVLIYGIFRFLNPVLTLDNILYFSFWTTLIFFHGIVIMLASAILSIPPLPRDCPEEKQGIKK